MRPSYDWDEAFEAALFETDRWKVNAAQAAIDRRLQEMNADHGGSPAERYAIQTAQAGLNVLRSTRSFNSSLLCPPLPL
jgi:hypothetical protein